MLFGEEHVKRYIESDGAEGHDWQGTTVLILTTTGRHSGQRRSTPLIYSAAARTIWSSPRRAGRTSRRRGT